MITPELDEQLTQCDREPIHNIGMIQPFGALLKMNADWVVAHRSANCQAMLDLEDDITIGSNIAEIFTPCATAALQKSLKSLTGKDQVERLFGVTLIAGTRPFDCAIHRVGDHIILEFEPHDSNDYTSHVAMIGPMLSVLGPIDELHTLCERGVEIVRDKLGYDRVMIYRFHADGSGEIIAERKRDDLEPLVGLRYPKSDIPSQARALFMRNKFRVIADIDSELVRIEPELATNGQPLDLSMSVLRASSSIHLAYLRNMGVRAALTIAIVRQGKLWGLISCHHYSPRLPPYSLRTVADMFSQFFSLMLDRILIAQSENLRAISRKMHDELMVRIAGGTDFAECLPMLNALLQKVVEHDGASILISGEYSTRGIAPNKDEFMALAPALGNAPISGVISSVNLAQDVPAARAFSDRVAGALIIPISRSPRDFFVLWRRPLSQTVKWAGDPKKTVVHSRVGGEDHLMPRASFAVWQETVEGCCGDWTDDELQIAESLKITLLEVILRMSDEAAQERARAHEKQALLISELNHRVRNILNLIRSLVTQSESGALNIAEFSANIGGRIAALASAHDNITRENWAPAPLSTLFESEFAAYLSERPGQLETSGEEVLIEPEAYTTLALVVHEMVTNSAKYGSLCEKEGFLSIALNRTPFGDLTIQWRESGGPPVKSPVRKGFGSLIIERSIPYELKGQADIRFEQSGLEADFLIPKRYIAPMPDVAKIPVLDEAQAKAKTDIVPLAERPDHILLVEDSMIIALDTQENLKRLGVPSIDVVASVKDAFEAIQTKEPDFAIVDYNLGSETSEPVTRALKTRNIPFVLATGYAEMAKQADKLGALSLLHKPYSIAEIQDLMRHWSQHRSNMSAAQGSSVARNAG